MSNTTLPVTTARREIIERTAWIAREAAQLADGVKASEGRTDPAGFKHIAETVSTLEQELHLLGRALAFLGHDPAVVAPRITRKNGSYIEPVAS